MRARDRVGETAPERPSAGDNKAHIWFLFEGKKCSLNAPKTGFFRLTL